MSYKLRLPLEFFKSPEWLQTRKFSTPEAYLDLLRIERFESLCDIDFTELSDRWGWSIEHTKIFVKRNIIKTKLQIGGKEWRVPPRED